MIRLSIFLLACVTATVAYSQQDPLYSQYINNPFVINPAYAGLTRNLNTSLSYRQQWSGYGGNPTTINANGHISLNNNKMGAGLMIVSDRIGVTTVNEVYATYAYRIRLSGDATLSFGLQGGLANFKSDDSQLTLQDPNDPLFTGETNAAKPNIGSGILLTSDKFLIGLSVPRMLNAQTNVGGFNSDLYTQHFYAMGSYLFFINERIRFKPSVLAKVVSGAPVSVDLNAALILYENYTAGLLTRNFSTYGVFLQAIIKNSFRLGYVMEVPTNRSVGTQYSTHEITLGFRLNVLSFHDNSGVTSF